MAGRPKKVSDEVVIQAAMQVMGELGPDGFSLAKIGERVNLSAAAVMRRFGSKQALIDEIGRYSHTLWTQAIDEARPETLSPLEGIINLYARMAKAMGTRQEALNHLGFLQQELATPLSRALLAGHEVALEREVQQHLDDAIAQGVLRAEVDTAQLAHLCGVVYMGALMRWIVQGPDTQNPKDDNPIKAVSRALITLMRAHMPQSAFGKSAGATA